MHSLFSLFNRLSVKISADKGMTGFLFGHYNDLMGSEVTHSNVFSEDSERIRNNRVENVFFFFFLLTLCALDLFSLRGKVTPLAQILVLHKRQKLDNYMGHVL